MWELTLTLKDSVSFIEYMIKRTTLVTLILIIVAGCSQGDSDLPSPVIEPSPKWLVPEEELFDGGVGKDGIPSVDDPQFGKTSEVNRAFDNELVLAVEHNGQIHAYPIPILDWHEIVNDEINGLPLAITYCPLTGTGVGWKRTFGSRTIAFGVSGLLYNSNLMPYDRRTNSTWSQQALLCVNGSRKGSIPEIFNLAETTLSTWKKMFPESEMMNANTGFDRRYSIYPYGDYRTNQDRLIFPVNHDDNRLPKKERVLGVIINGKARVYQFNEEADGIEVIHDEFQDQKLIIVVSARDNFIKAFLNPSRTPFVPTADAFPAIMTDDDQNSYDIFGRHLNSLDPELKLASPVSFMGYWFSWPAFYPDVEIFKE